MGAIETPATTNGQPDEDGASSFSLGRASARVLLLQSVALLGLWLLQSCYGSG